MWLSLTMNGILCAHLPADRAEHAEGRGERVAAALDGEPDEVLGVEVHGVRREARAAGVLDALVDRQDRDVAGAGQAARSRSSHCEVAQDVRLDRSRRRDDAVDEVRARQVQLRRRRSSVLTCWSSASASSPSSSSRRVDVSVLATSVVSVGPPEEVVAWLQSSRAVGRLPRQHGAPLHRAELHDRHRGGAHDRRRGDATTSSTRSSRSSRTAPDGEIKPELMESVLEIATHPCAEHGRGGRSSCAALRRQVRETAARQGPDDRLGRHASVRDVGGPADRRAPALPRPDQRAALRRAPGADLRACTSTSASTTPTRRSTSPTGCASTCRSCWR